MNTLRLLPALAVLLASAPAAVAAPATFTIDPVHTSITFTVRHFVTNFTGEFAKFSGDVTWDADDPANCKCTAIIDVGSVSTRNERRDNDLRSKNFFDVEGHPEITWTSTEWKKVDDKHYKVTGDLTMLGQTHPVTLDVEFMGTVKGPRNSEVAGWHGEGKIDRSTWGMTHGGGVVGDEVQINLDVEAHRPL